MNKQILKNIRDNLPEPLKLISAPLFRNKLLKNIQYLRYEEMLEERENLSLDEIQAHQFKELKAILVHACQNVPFYKKLFNDSNFNPYEIKYCDDIDVLPFLTKNIIRQNFDKLISEIKIPGGYYIATTGGSTGEPLKVLLDYDCVFTENAFVNYFRKKLGYQKRNRLVTFRGVEFGERLWKFNPMQNEYIFSPFKISKKTLQIYLSKIERIKPDFLNGYLSALHYFAKLLSNNNLKIMNPIKGIFLISENINKTQRAFLEDFFQIKTSTFYGHSERCIIAEEIQPNEYKFDPYYGYTELIQNKDSSLAIVGTGFLNKTMPLIRYKTDDICRRVGDLFTIDGRRKSTEGLYGVNGEFFSHAAFNFHSEIFKNVTSYQFVQRQKGKADLLIIVNNDFKTHEIDLMKKEIDKKTKGVMEFDIRIVENLILSQRGKFKMFVSNHIDK
ncbi:phenylacetate--CoA ligase family protein [Desulfobacter postgatei]|uniref:Coenzyme F390 synthetase n=1 Tax=Desulfobacter postgatei 2ac9 TaxID=879212 RepID=I5B6K5_9BACT|nr:phenylacetate--CoA ligase family protein [Desulfobacter postgatei]EIM65118.1 coenzyme F390 synthetase [Desulfobacter postgatei 2ac9]